MRNIRVLSEDYKEVYNTNSGWIKPDVDRQYYILKFFNRGAWWEVGMSPEKLNTLVHREIDINEFNVIEDIYEIGETVSTLDFKWKVSVEPLTSVVTWESNKDQHIVEVPLPALDIEKDPDKILKGTLTYTAKDATEEITKDTTFTITCEGLDLKADPRPFTAIKDVIFSNKVFYNVDVNTPTIEVDVRALGVNGNIADTLWERRIEEFNVPILELTKVIIATTKDIKYVTTSDHEDVTDRFIKLQDVLFANGETYHVYKYEPLLKTKLGFTIKF